MKKLGVLILLMLAAGPVAAQDAAAPAEGAEQETTGFGTAEEAAPEATPEASVEPSAEAPAEDAAAASEPADAASADAAPSEAPTETAAEPAAEAAAETPAEAEVVDSTVVEETAETAEVAEESTEGTEAAAADESEPWQLYVGSDYVWTRAKFSQSEFVTEFGAEELDSNMIRARVGMRLFEKIGLEVQLGTGTADNEDLEADEYSTQEFYGAYLVPTGVLFDLIEVGASIGYAHTKLETATASETLGGVSFGVNIDIPLYASEAVELRVGGGGSMFRAQNSAQISGYYAGLRVDFRI